MALRSLALGTASLLLAVAGAHATMGAKTMLERVDSNHDGTVSRAEVIAAAGRKYDLIASRNGGHVTLLALGGRLSKDSVQSITKSDESKSRTADPDSVTREQYIEQAEGAFDQAKFGKPGGNRSKDDNLTLGEMSAPAAEKLIDLLE